MGEEFSGDDDFPVEGKSWEEIEIFISKVSDASAELEGEWRLPSESEWLLAQKNLGITVPVSHEELLSDHPHPNHRGAPTDGRPREDTDARSMMRRYRISRKAHPKKMGISVKSQAPVKNGQSGMVFRLVFIPQQFTSEIVGDCKLVPDDVDVARLFKREATIALFIGVIPSFAIPIIRGFSDYAIEGWVNLLFGGLLISFVSSVFWRPRTETWVFSEDGESLERRWLSGKEL